MTNAVKVSGSQIISLSVILNFAQTYSLWDGLGYVPVGHSSRYSELIQMLIHRNEILLT